jgi:hypothetical protein
MEEKKEKKEKEKPNSKLFMGQEMCYDTRKMLHVFLDVSKKVTINFLNSMVIFTLTSKNKST